MTSYAQAFRGGFYGVLRWTDLDRLWQTLMQSPEGWFVYDTLQAPPEAPMPVATFVEFVKNTDAYLKKEHDEDYCGIVYIDDETNPAFIKIYDPNNLGVVCGFSEAPPLPRWILSRLTPSDLANPESTDQKPPWWKRLLRRRG